MVGRFYYNYNTSCIWNYLWYVLFTLAITATTDDALYSIIVSHMVLGTDETLVNHTDI